MNPKIKELWVKELRSGDFEQGEGLLRDGNKCCCLGVLCELAIEQGVDLRVSDNKGVYAYDGKNSVLPEAVVDWAGLEGQNPSSPFGSLSGLNDSGKSFEYIADIIREFL